MRISYLICSHRAPPEIETALRSVVAEMTAESELILVNNGFSAERERALIAEFNFSPASPRRLVSEPRAGLGFARLRGFAEASGDVLVLLDDDNELERGFEEKLRACCSRHPRWGSICPAVMPIWEQPVPRWLEDFGRLCLSFTHPHAPVANEPDREWTKQERKHAERAPGGGMIVHREVIDAYRRVISGTSRAELARTGANLGGCEDADLFRQVWPVDRTAVRCTELRLFHRIPASRCRMNYLLRLNFSMTRSYATLDRLCGLSFVRLVVRHGIKPSVRAIFDGIWDSLRALHPQPLLLHAARASGGWAGLFGRREVSAATPDLADTE